MGAAGGIVSSFAQAAGSMLGGGGGGGGGGGASVDPGIAIRAKNESLSYLDNALRSSIPYSEYFTEKAIGEQRRQFDIARSDVKEYYERSQAQIAPYREAGFQALDQLQDTLGLPRLSSGSSALYHAMENRAIEKAARSRMQGAAMRHGQEMGMDPQTMLSFAQTASYGGNFEGLMQALKEYRTGNPYQAKPLSATDTPTFGEGENAREGGPSPYNDILGKTSGRFDVNPYTAFTAEAYPLSQELNRSRNNLSSRQRVLAQLGKTGYSHIRPKVRDI